MENLNNNKQPINGRLLQQYALRPAPKLVKVVPSFPQAGTHEWLDVLLVMPIDAEAEKKFVTQINRENNQ